MKACISTYCTWMSYGSIFQATGLSRALSSLGCESYILKDMSETEPLIHLPKSVKQILRLPLDCLNITNRAAVRRKGRAFIQDNLETKSYQDYERLCGNPPAADLYICGSDQIWHPDLMKPVFFLDFVHGAKKSSYAASMGKTDVSDEAKVLYRKYLKEFQSVSVREVECRDILTECTDSPIAVNIDPVFFLSAEDWRHYEKEYPVRQPYILLYTIYRNDALRKQMSQLGKRLGLPVYTIKSGATRDYADKALLNVGPAEFLWLIDHASYVVTSSFHGVALSTIFHKQYSAVIDPSHPSRISGLLDTLNVPRIRIDSLGKEVIDYTPVDERINVERERGLDFLRSSLQ